MITDAVFTAFFACIGSIISLFPSVSLPAISPGGLATEWGSIVNAIFPLSDAITVLVAILAIRVGLQLWDFTVWVYHQFWGGD